MMSSKLPGVLCLAGLLFGSGAASAQNLQEKPLPSLLTPQSQGVLDKLASLIGSAQARLALSRRRSGTRGVSVTGRCRLAGCRQFVAGGGYLDAGNHRSSQNAQRLRSDRYADFVSPASGCQRASHPDCLLQRTPGGHGNGPGTDHAFPRRPSGRQSAGSRKAAAERRSKALSMVRS